MVNINMKWNGRGNLKQMVVELERQRLSKIDFVSDMRQLQVIGFDGEFDGDEDRCLKLGAVPGTATTEWLTKLHRIGHHALPQFGARVDPAIPGQWLRKMADQHTGHTSTILTRLMHDTGKRNLVRCLDGEVRAFLSNSYKVLDSLDIAFASLEAAKREGAVPLEANLSDTRMRLKLVNFDMMEALEQEAVENSPHQFIGADALIRRLGINPADLPGEPNSIFPVITVSNSETGHGGFSVKLGIMLRACINTCTIEDVAGEIHLGGKLDVGLFSRETQTLEARTIMAKACESVQAAFTPDKWAAMVEKARDAQGTVIRDPSSAVEHFVKTQDVFPESKKDQLLMHFVGDYDRTAWGFAQAVARVAQDEESADTAATLEALAGEVIKEPKLIAVPIAA